MNTELVLGITRKKNPQSPDQEVNTELVLGITREKNPESPDQEVNTELVLRITRKKKPVIPTYISCRGRVGFSFLFKSRTRPRIFLGPKLNSSQCARGKYSLQENCNRETTNFVTLGTGNTKQKMY